ncbi:MAG: SLC13 family permease, partial [Bacillota bacterium]
EPEEDLVEEYEMKLFIAEVVVEQDSPLIGKSINQTLNQMELDLDLVMITRDGEEFVEPLEAKSIKAGDRLVIRSDRNTLIQVMDTQGLSFPLEYQIEEKKLEQPEEGRKLIEGVITNGSIFAGKTLTELNFMERYDCSVLALRRGSELSHYRLDEIVLQAGDVLLMVTNKSTLERLRQRRDIIITREMEQKDYQREKIPYVIGIMAGVVFFGVTELVPLSVAALLGIALMVITGCINPAEMYQSVNWEIIILMAGLIPLGTAMGKTGTADFLAAQIIKLIGDLPGVYLLALFYLFTALVTNIMSNRASIVVMLPVAVDTALRLGAAPFPFILAVTFAANTAYLTPIANQVHLLVFGPGGYRFGDYFRVGLPLQLILTVVVTTGLLLFWGT